MPEIYAKSTLNVSNAEAKTKIGHDGLEIQLLSELVEDDSKGIYHTAESVFSLARLKQYPVTVIHAPLYVEGTVYNLENLVTKKRVKLLHEVFHIANYYGMYQDMEVKVVVHTELSYSLMKELGIWDNIVKTVDCMLRMFPYTQLVIENVTMLRSVHGLRYSSLCNNARFECTEVVRQLREKLQTSRIYTCLDTCHAMMSEREHKLFYANVFNRASEDLSLDRYFENFKDTVGLIHLADMKGMGIAETDHGVPFTEETYGRLDEILSLYKKYKYTCPITLEVREKDYLINDGYKETKRLVTQWFEKSNIL